MGRLMIIGLDALDPRILFETHAHFMPRLSDLAQRGASGRLRSTFPPITVPAWVSMTTGLEPGHLGLYGFRERVSGSYEMRVHDARDVREPRLWENLAKRGKRSVILGVPLTYPPPESFEGLLVSGPLTPGPGSQYTSPPELRGEIEKRFGPYIPDVEGFRDAGREGLLDRIIEASTQKFEIAEWLIGRTRWDLFMMVDMGIDRFQHAFLKLLDPDHPAWRDTPGPTPEEIETGRSFLMRIDILAGRLIDLAEEDTTVIVVSDHGARPLEGGFAVNDWLIREGYLVLRETPPAPVRLEPGMVDWSRTRAWGEGGYVARVYINMQGREPEGTVAQGREAARLVTEIKDGIEALEGPDGRPMKNRAVRPGDLYREVRGLPPDLMADLAGLAYRAVATCGNDGIFVPGSDTGPDDANHDHEGIIVMAGPGIPAGSRVEIASVTDMMHFAEDALSERRSIPPGAWPE